MRILCSTFKLQMAFVLSLGLAVVVGLGLQYGSVVFTRDKHVVQIIAIGVPVCTSPNMIIRNPKNFEITCCDESILKTSVTLPFYHQFVAATQPINYLAFAFDGLYYGVSDFAYSAYSMVSYDRPPLLLNSGQ